MTGTRPKSYLSVPDLLYLLGRVALCAVYLTVLTLFLNYP